jgi:hypothetical protein
MSALTKNQPPVLVIEASEEEVAMLRRMWEQGAARPARGFVLGPVELQANVITETRPEPEKPAPDWDDAGLYGEGS